MFLLELKDVLLIKISSFNNWFIYLAILLESSLKYSLNFKIVSYPFEIALIIETYKPLVTTSVVITLLGSSINTVVSLKIDYLSSLQSFLKYLKEINNKEMYLLDLKI